MTGLSAGALARDRRGVHSRDGPPASGQTGGKPKAGGRGTTVRHPDRARPIHPAGVAAGAATGVGSDLFGSQLGVPSGALTGEDCEARAKGTPPGGPRAARLSNLLLDGLTRSWSVEGTGSCVTRRMAPST